MKLTYTTIPVSIVMLFLAGCATSPVDIKGSPILEPTKLQGAPVQPYAETYPISPLQQPAASSRPVMSEPAPVWENSQIQKVAVDAFVDENGNLHPKSYMYVVTKKGGWNLDAVRKPNSYVPPENTVTPMNGFGYNYGKSYTYAQNEQPGVSSLLLNDTNHIRITGLTNPNDGEKARLQANTQTEVAIFDPYVGWVITPKNSMANSNTLPNVYKEEASRANLANSFGQIERPIENKNIPQAPNMPIPQQNPVQFPQPPVNIGNAPVAPVPDAAPAGGSENLFQDF